MSPFLQRLIDDNMLQEYVIVAGKVVVGVDLGGLFVWDQRGYLKYWQKCYKELGLNSCLTKEDVDYIYINYPELFV